jgi:hypothetical protein
MKHKKLLLISAGVFLVFALVMLLVGGYIAGWDILGWFTSKYAMWMYLIGGLYILFVVGLVIYDKIKNI